MYKNAKSSANPRSTHTFQSRLGIHRDHTSQVLTDFIIKETGDAASNLHLRIREHLDSDTITTTLRSMGGINAIWPDLNDIAVVYKWQEDDGAWCNVAFPSLIEETEPFKLVIPNSDLVQTNDLVLRILLNKNPLGVIVPAVIPFKITEMKGQFGHNSIEYNSCDAVYYAESKTPAMKEAITRMVEQRLILGW